jgi:hypothetical protein
VTLGKCDRYRSAKALPGKESAEEKDANSEIFNICSEKARRDMVEKRLAERKTREEGNEMRRQRQVQSGNEMGLKKRGLKRRPTGSNIVKANIGPFLSTVYLPQEALFHAIDVLFKGMFAAGSSSWRADTRHFKPPRNTPDSAKAWQLLSDQVESIHMLVDAELYQHANFMVEEVLTGLKAATGPCEPSFMVHFWKICHMLAGVPERRKIKTQRSTWIAWFLRNLKQILSSMFDEHSLIVMVDSLLSVWETSPRDLKPTLGLGQWKAIHTLGSLIGNTHNIVLNMGAYCTKNWKSKFSAASNMAELLHQSLLDADRHHLGVEQTAEAFLDYLLAAAKEKYNEIDIINAATQLSAWAGRICLEKSHWHVLQYDSVTRAFVYSSKLVATHHLETWKQPEQKQNKSPNRELSYKYMSEVIEILRYGDLQCRIRAASFSKRLSTWFKGHPQKKGDRLETVAIEEEMAKVLEEKARMREIVRQIPKQRIKGSRKRKWVGGRRKTASRAEKTLARDLLFASLLPKAPA